MQTHILRELLHLRLVAISWLLIAPLTKRSIFKLICVVKSVQDLKVKRPFKIAFAKFIFFRGCVPHTDCAQQTTNNFYFAFKMGHNIRMYMICVLHTDNQKRGGLGLFYPQTYTKPQLLTHCKAAQNDHNALRTHYAILKITPHSKSCCSRYSYHGLWDLAWKFLSLSWWCPRWVGDGCSSSPRFLYFSLFVLVRWETPFLTELLFINRLADIFRIGLRLRQREK